jgi:hypothetical protein
MEEAEEKQNDESHLHTIQHSKNITTDVVNNISICKAELRQLTENHKEIKQKPLGISASTKVAFILSKIRG